MTIIMADAITAANLKAAVDANPSIGAVAGYDNGSWPDFAAIAAEEPTKHLLDFTVKFANLGTGGDFEPGDMDPANVVAYVRERQAAGVWRPVVYASIAGYMIQIIANLRAAGIALSSVRLLSAHYGAGKHICGPDTCKLGAAASSYMDGTQWIDHGSWDESLLQDTFFPSIAPVPQPQPDPPVVHTYGDDMKSITTTIGEKSGHGWCASPVAVEQVTAVFILDENPESVGRYDNVPAFQGKATQRTKDAPNGALIFDSGGDGSWGVEIQYVDPT